MQHRLVFLPGGLAPARIGPQAQVSVGPNHAYARLADACLDVLAGRRLKRRGYLDMIDKWYTSVIGGENRYLSETGDIRRSELMDAMVKAANEIDGTQATSFDEIVEGVQR